MEEQDAVRLATQLWGKGVIVTPMRKLTGAKFQTDTEWWVDEKEWDRSHGLGEDGRPTCHKACMKREEELYLAAQKDDNPDDSEDLDVDDDDDEDDDDEPEPEDDDD